MRGGSDNTGFGLHMPLLNTARRWGWKPGVVLALLLVALGLFRLEAGESPSPLSLASAPSPVPDRIILTWSGDPATTQTVTWRTDETVTAPVAQIAPALATPDLAAHAHEVSASSTPLRTEEGLAYYHSVHFADLEPGTLYAYRVGGGGAWSEWFQFRTASREPEPFSFIYFGDAQNGVRSLWSRVLRAAFADAPDARFLIHAGDLVNLRGRWHDREWGGWFDAGDWLYAMLPSIPAVGNHEYVGSQTGSDILTPHWRAQFALPGNGPPELAETTYYLDYQGVRIIVLNSAEAFDVERAVEQARWMEPLLANNPNRWTVVVFHHPVFPISKERDTPDLRTHWQPLFQRYDVDLVLQGHDHAYGRTIYPPDAAATQEMPPGPVYVVSVGGAKMYEIDEDAAWMERLGEDLQLYQIIRVAQDRLSFEAKTATGEVYDAFELIEQADGSRLLLEPPLVRPPSDALEGETP